MGAAAVFGAALAVLPALAPPFQQEATGAPTPWRQGVEYHVEARLDESRDVLEGRARVLYRNDSPHTLDAFYFHLYLNAFRPNSLWARTDLEHGITTFQELGPGEHAYERLAGMTADGRPVELRYPYAPDSTIVGFDLSDPLEPGETVVLEYRWDARLSTVPRRQGRRGRHYDFAQWYPRVVVYDDEGWRAHPLYRQGEFYGEFATYDVTLDVAADQVLGATGVPVEGDPGWEGAAALGTGPVDYQREWYGSLEGPPCIERGDERICNAFPARRLPETPSLGHLEEAPDPGRKRVRWRAEDVHHFAWSASPDYTYEQGRWRDVTIHVLYQPGDEETWGGGVAVRRTAVALEWLDGVFGDYAWPQVTNLHRVEGGGTEFPMVVMDGSASQSLILHEVGHMYAHGMLANNEWYEGWLDEGLASFVTAWFFERAGAGDAVWENGRLSVVLDDLLGRSEPVVLPAEDYRDYGTYGAMIYGKGEIIFWMLREMAGEEDFLRILRTYFERYRLRHVDSDAFQQVAEEVLRTDLDWFFGQWLHGTGVVDYALDRVAVVREERAWRTHLGIERVGDLLMPVPVRLTGASGTTRDVVLQGTALEAEHVVRTAFEPVRVEIDPDGTILDWNVANNGWEPGPFSNPAREVGWGHPLRPVPLRWRTVPVELLPLLWYNDGGGWVGGVQLRTARLGFADRAVLRVGLPAVEAGDRGGLSDGTDPGSLYGRLENPILGGRPRVGLALEGFAGEGRLMARSSFQARDSRGGDGAAPRVFGALYGVYDEAYLVPGRWSPGSHMGAEVGVGITAAVGASDAPVTLDGSLAGGFDSGDRRWIRATGSANGQRELAEGWTLRGRAFAGGVLAASPGDGQGERWWSPRNAPRERMFFLAGGDPLQALSNPWVRSAGAPLAEHGFVPGGGELRGFAAAAALPVLGALRLELAAPALEVAAGGGWAVRPVAFAGVAVGAEAVDRAGPGVEGDPLWSGGAVEGGHLFHSVGAGLEVGPRGSPMRLRLDLPFLVSDPELAATETGESAGFRWTLSITGG